MISKIYPLQFTPILKDRLWGGIKLKSVLHKSITSKNVGESWEISSIDGDVSIVSNGALAGMSLNDLIDSNPDAILGTHVHKQFGKQFPLLFKFLDAQKDLSIQVHPNDELAKKKQTLPHPTFFAPFRCRSPKPPKIAVCRRLWGKYFQNLKKFVNISQHSARNI